MDFIQLELLIGFTLFIACYSDLTVAFEVSN